jgi:hypothetical protein
MKAEPFMLGYMILFLKMISLKHEKENYTIWKHL